MILGIFLGASTAWLIVGLAMFHHRSPILTVDPWWLENEERWASLRPMLLAERAGKSAANGSSRDAGATT